MEKIGIFGGTFNPPHRGHITAAKQVKEKLGLDRVMFIPALQPPHKSVPTGSPDAGTRLAMINAALKDEPGLEASDIELRRTGKSYTADTLTELKSIYPDDTLYFIMGTDMFLTLDSWYHPEIICDKAILVGMCRMEKESVADLKAQKKKLQAKYGAEVVLVENEPVEISSSRVRRLLILGGAQAYVPEAVLEIIREKGLYGVNENYKNLPEDRLRQVCAGLLKEKRVNHVMGCAETAVKLAQKYGADPVIALRAGLLHDITKAIDGPDQLLLVDEYHMEISPFERTHPKLLHAKTGAAVAKYVFGECPEVCEAIYWHTTGRADMTLMEKILYIADYMEPTRDFPGVDDLRETVWKDLDEGLLMGLEMCIEEIIRENKTLCTDSADARDFMRRQLGRA